MEGLDVQLSFTMSRRVIDVKSKPRSPSNVASCPSCFRPLTEESFSVSGHVTIDGEATDGRDEDDWDMDCDAHIDVTCWNCPWWTSFPIRVPVKVNIEWTPDPLVKALLDSDVLRDTEADRVARERKESEIEAAAVIA